MAIKDYIQATVLDLNSRFDITPTKIIVASMPRDEDAYVYFDEGADFFNGSRNINFKVTPSLPDASTGVCALLMLTNDIGNLKGLADDSKSFFAISSNTSAAGFNFRLREYNAGSVTFDTYSGGTAFDIAKYLTWAWDKTVGAFGTIYLDVYSDEDRDVILDTLIVTLTQDLDLQYLFQIASNNDGSTGNGTNYIIENLEYIGAVISGKGPGGFRGFGKLGKI